MVYEPRFRMGPPPRSFAADAYDCIMVAILAGSTEYKFVARYSRLMASSPRYRRNGNIKWAVGNTSEKQTLKSASVIQFNKSAAVLATVKGKSLRDGLRPPLTAAARSGQRKLGWDEEMVAVRSNKEMVKNSSLDTNRPIQVTDRAMEAWYIPPLHE